MRAGRRRRAGRACGSPAPCRAGRMSSVKEVIVSSWAIFGSLTNVPLPWRRTSMPSRTRSSSAARTVRRETPRSCAQLALGRDRVADAELLDQVEHAVARLALLRDVGRLVPLAVFSLVAIVVLVINTSYAGRGAASAAIGASQQERCAARRVEEMEAGGVDCERRRDPRRAPGCAGRPGGEERSSRRRAGSRRLLARDRLGGDAGASTRKNACVSAPSSSTHLDVDARRAAAPRLRVRRPRTPRAGCRARRGERLRPGAGRHRAARGSRRTRPRRPRSTPRRGSSRASR